MAVQSNEWTGKRCFEGKSLHSLGSTQNPYEAAVSAIAKTLVPFDDDALIPCYGFGDSNTNDRCAKQYPPVLCSLLS